MRPRLLPIASATSFALALLIAALWLRSHYSHDAVLTSRSDIRSGSYIGTFHRLESDRGAICFVWTREYFRVSDKQGIADWRDTFLDERGSLRFTTHEPGWGYVIASYAASATTSSFWYRSGLFLHWGQAHNWELPDHPLTLTSFGLLVPHWLLATLFLLLPTLTTFRHLRRRHRLRTNHCPHCNYDLRSTPTQCPECGARLPPSSPTVP